MWELLGVIIVCTGISLGITILFQRKNNERIGNALETTVNALKDSFSLELEPILKTNSIAMSQLQAKGVESRQLRSLEKDVGKDIMNQYGVEMEVIEAAFPSVAERLRGNPQLILQFLPRLKQLMQNTDFERLGFKQESKFGKHPFWDER